MGSTGNVALRPIPRSEGPDIDSTDELEAFVRAFYGSVAQDALLGPVFNDVAQVDWSEHLPKLVAFWSRFLFGIRGYDGNPFAMHRAIHEQRPFTPDLFERWLELFDETIDESWAGENVDRMKHLVRNVARVHSQQLIGPTNMDSPE